MYVCNSSGAPPNTNTEGQRQRECLGSWPRGGGFPEIAAGTCSRCMFAAQLLKKFGEGDGDVMTPGWRNLFFNLR
jgi:hypothetical protein